ncbi:MAG: TIGR01777 family oxidoreductase [Gammaproteobacteria bacterium]|nr:TIGR01777 family oxidoreductase [Gammaproteobacteria bacterium]
MRILITGGSGFLGQAMSRALTWRGDEVVILSRHPHLHLARKAGTQWIGSLEQVQQPVDAVINLTGANLFSRPWTTRHRQALRDSRIAATEKLISWICEQPQPPRVLLSGSAIGFYGDGGEQALTEDSPAGTDWASTLVKDWELATASAAAAGIRTVSLRTGLVLGEGGLLAPLVPLFRFGLGGSLGNGQFWYSWIHLQDWVNATLMLLDSKALQGPFNLTAPHPVRYHEFASALGTSLRRPVWLTPPAWVLRLLLGERASLMLGSTKALPVRLEAAGFKWQHERLNEALHDIVQTRLD